MDSPCRCHAIGRGVQTFRIRHPERLFDIGADLGGLHEHFIGARAVWACRDCGQLFAWMRIPYKDEEEIIVRAASLEWQKWDWRALADVAGGCRWRGPDLDERYVL